MKFSSDEIFQGTVAWDWGSFLCYLMSAAGPPSAPSSFCEQPTAMWTALLNIAAATHWQGRPAANDHH
jgi:hypothetical protein